MWHVAYELRADEDRVTQMRDLSRDDRRLEMGLAPKPYLVGSRRFWRAIASGRLPTVVVEGEITRVYWGSMGDWPEFEIAADEGQKSTWTREGDPARFVEGLKARVECVEMPWKPRVPHRVDQLDKLVIRILVEESELRSNPTAPGPGGIGYQLEVCRRLNAEPMPVGLDAMVGVAENVRDDIEPLNGLRHPPDDDTSGWYLWRGETLSDEPDFFKPVHARHLSDWCPEAIPYLALPPGWRFLLADGHEDVWFDSEVLEE
jgi:hypothetical protein